MILGPLAGRLGPWIADHATTEAAADVAKEEKVVRPPTETATVSALAASGSAPRTEVRCCPKCEGQRELREEYNFRLIYRECDFCDGEGTISFDMEGKRILAVRTSVYPQ